MESFLLLQFDLQIASTSFWDFESESTGHDIGVLGRQALRKLYFRAGPPPLLSSKVLLTWTL